MAYFDMQTEDRPSQFSFTLKTNRLHDPTMLNSPPTDLSQGWLSPRSRSASLPDYLNRRSKSPRYKFTSSGEDDDVSLASTVKSTLRRSRKMTDRATSTFGHPLSDESQTSNTLKAIDIRRARLQSLIAENQGRNRRASIDRSCMTQERPKIAPPKKLVISQDLSNERKTSTNAVTYSTLAKQPRAKLSSSDTSTGANDSSPSNNENCRQDNRVVSNGASFSTENNSHSNNSDATTTMMNEFRGDADLTPRWPTQSVALIPATTNASQSFGVVPNDQPLVQYPRETTPSGAMTSSRFLASSQPVPSSTLKSNNGAMTTTTTMSHHYSRNLPKLSYINFLIFVSIVGLLLLLPIGLIALVYAIKARENLLKIRAIAQTSHLTRKSATLKHRTLPRGNKGTTEFTSVAVRVPSGLCGETQKFVRFAEFSLIICAITVVYIGLLVFFAIFLFDTTSILLKITEWYNKISPSSLTKSTIDHLKTYEPAAISQLSHRAPPAVEIFPKVIGPGYSPSLIRSKQPSIKNDIFDQDYIYPHSSQT